MVAGLFLVLLPFFVSIRDVAGWDGNLFEVLTTERVRSSIYGSLMLAFSTAIAGALIGVPAFFLVMNCPFQRYGLLSSSSLGHALLYKCL